ncbi:MAG: helix-turn-helix transcriptional regulator [Bacteroidota bacterium]
MMKKEPTYEELRKQYSDEEIVESFVFRSNMSKEEKALADAEFKRLRLEQLKNMSDKQVLKGELMRMKLLQRDYFKQSSYSATYSFDQQLKTYIDLLKKSRKSVAEDLDIHPTKLSRILNGKENPNIDLMYRLERHSGNMIPATHWYRLFTRKVEHDIRQNAEHRQKEYERVKNVLVF